ncbi:AmmeMemoRadiSam system protein B [Desulfospira joergensenii]|uniref:AmmeMemoRadiSam system protein B n=1 Tax=Desulfospira joergensenii TaxID=53329 RepID=UPI0003B3BBA6|nr:AmmeMemoRadiSam system protein B [Desulfospira joergensenii]
METKKMAFSGSWYPSSASECETSIEKFLTEGEGPLQGEFLAGIVPHAGWFYSGSIACRVIASLQPRDGEEVDTIVLFGAHMHEQSEPFVMAQGLIETPLGRIEVDEELAGSLAAGAGIQPLTPGRFPDENTLELQYPFIKHFFPRARILVCGVAPSFLASVIGRTSVEEAQNLNRSIRVIGSTDMSHYGPDFGFTPAGIGQKAVDWVTQENDAGAVKAMKTMDEDKIISQGLARKNMCCPGAAAAAAAAAKKMGAVKAVELDYATSFEKSRSDSFVGYAGVVYSRPLI